MRNVTNLPVKRNKADYVKAQIDFSAHFKTVPGIVSIYHAGNIGHPGISDLDFILCLEDSLLATGRFEDYIPGHVRELIGDGSILKINRRNFSVIKIIDDFPLQHLAGEKFKFREFDDFYSQICRVCDWLPERYYTLWKLRSDSQLNVVRALQLLKSAGHTLSLAGELLDSSQLDRTYREVMELRDNWFVNEKDSLRRLDSLLSESLVALFSGMNLVSNWLQTNGMIKINGDAGKLIWRVPQGPQLSGEGVSLGVMPESVQVPGVFLAFIAHQGHIGEGLISRYLQGSFSNIDGIEVRMAKDLDRVMKARIDFVDSVAKFFVANKLKSGLLKYGWFMQNYVQAEG